MGLAHRVAVVSAVAVRLAQRPHRLRQRREGSQRIGTGFSPAPGSRPPRAVLDHVLPPALGIVVPGRLGQHPDRIDPYIGLRGSLLLTGPVGRGHRASGVSAIGVPLADALLLAVGVRAGRRIPVGRPPIGGLSLLPHGQGVGRGQIDEADGDAALQCPAHRHPLRGELGQRPERRAAGIVLYMGEQRDGRPHPLLGGERHQRVRLRRALDQDRVGRALIQGGPHRPRRPGAVMPHPEQHRPAPVRCPLATLAHALASRQAR